MRPGCGAEKTPGALRLLALLAVLALALSVIPLYGAAMYAYPGPDDYRYGLTTHQVWEESRSVFALLTEAGRVSAETYRTWQGSYAAIFLMSLQPGIFSPRAYGIGPCLLITVLALSVLYFVYTAVCALLSGTSPEKGGTVRAAGTLLGALAAFCCVQFQPYPVEGYFWYNGGVYYTFFFSLALVAGALLLKREQKRAAVSAVLLPILMFLISGGNLITAFLSSGLLLLYVCGRGLLGRKADRLLVCCLLLLLSLFAVNAFAPGNGVRQLEHADVARSPLAAIGAALLDGAVYSCKWAGNPATFLCVACVPLFWYMAGLTELRFRRPLVLAVFSYLLLSAGFTPTEYALGFAGEYRILDMQFYLFVLLLLLNLFWLTGWLRRRAKPLSKKAARRLAGAVCGAGVLLALGSAVAGRSGACVSAARILVNGAARSYGETWEERLALLTEDSAETVTLPRFTSKPPLLCPLDVTGRVTDTYYWYNQQIEAYYGKSRVLRQLGPED